MPNEHRADTTPPPHHGQGRGGSKKESFSLRVTYTSQKDPPHVTPTWADHGLGRETREHPLIYAVVNSGHGLANEEITVTQCVS